MKEKEILEGNKLIAEFMGIETEELSFKKDPDMVFLIPKDSEWTEGIHNLCYERDWSLLMPVIEKIEGLGYDTHIVKLQNSKRWACDIILKKRKNGKHELATSLSPFSKILSVWYAIIQFIEWHNKQNKK